MDPNVLVSAALSEKGAPWRIVRLWHEGSFEMIVSLHLLYELQTVLMRQKFRRYRTEEEALEFVTWIHEGATLTSEEETPSMSRDPEDDYLLALAESSDANYLVSGDGDLLDIEEPPIKMISPRAFHEILRNQREAT